MNRPAFLLIAVAVWMAGCASDPYAARAGATGTQSLVPATGPAAPVVNSGDATPSIGSGIGPSDPALGMTPGFPVDPRR